MRLLCTGTLLEGNHLNKVWRGMAQRSNSLEPGLPMMVKWVPKKEAVNTLRESQSKLYEIDMIRRHMQGNTVKPVLLINTDALNAAASDEATQEAGAMLDRLQRLARAEALDVIEAASPMEAAEHVSALT